MPSDKKRINLTVPDDVYELLQKYKKNACISNDATACLQLIIQQLKAEAGKQTVMKFFESLSIEQLQQVSNEGLEFLKKHL